MMINKKVIWLFLFILIPVFASADSPAGPGNKWINHTDLKNVVTIAMDRSAPLAYCGSEGGLFVVNVESGEIVRKYTNIDGLISNNITAVYIDTLDRLWIGTADGSISILNFSSNTFKYIYDIKNSNESNKNIYDFIQFGNYMFVATGYGIQKISVLNLSFTDAPYYQLGTFPGKTKVTTMTILNSRLFAGSAVGVAYVNLYNTNLNDPMSWTNYSQAPLNSNLKCSETFDGKAFFGSTTGFGYFDGQYWQSFPDPGIAASQIFDTKAIGDKLYIIAGGYVFFVPKTNLAQVSQYTPQGTYLTLNNYNDTPLIGVFELGLGYYKNSVFTTVYPNCPYRNSFEYLSIGQDGVLWTAGGQDLTGAYSGFYKYQDNVWTAYNTSTTPPVGNSNFFRRIFSSNGTVWALCYGGGATRVQGERINNFNPQNSPLPGIQGYPNYCVPFGGAYDNAGMFWMSFYGTDKSKSLYAVTGDSTFLGFNNPDVVLAARFEHMAIDNYNTKWITSSGNPGGLYFFNENGSLYNTADDIYGFYNVNDFESNDITSVIVDKNNEVWVTTINGIFVISDPYAAIVNPNNKPAPRKLGLISGNIQVPFTENCKCIASDVLNQKWVGTKNNGVFHLSSDGTTLIEQFNTTNSPLLNNEITSIAVNPADGRAYFGSLYGLSSVQTDAISPLAEFDKIICSPNPYLVPPKVNLRIDGLVENSSVKIITLTGDVVAEFDSPGGKIASWDGKDKRGNYVPSGVYIVVGFNKDGSKVGKGKLAVVKR